jgi:hypothetical protein
MPRIFGAGLALVTRPGLFRQTARSRNSAFSPRPFSGPKGPQNGPFPEQKVDNVHDPQNAHLPILACHASLAPALRVRLCSTNRPNPGPNSNLSSSMGALVLCMMVITVSLVLLVRIWTTNTMATTPTFLRGRSSRSLVYAGADSLDAPDACRSMNALPLCMAIAAFGCAVPTRSCLHRDIPATTDCCG